MDLLENECVISQIILAASIRKGTPFHKNRASHGLAFNIDMTSTYCFDTGEVLACHSGDLIYLPKGSNYTVETNVDRDTKEHGVYVINFLTVFEQNENHPCLIKMNGTEKIISLFSKAAYAWNQKSIGYYEECMSDLYQILKILKINCARYVPYEKNTAALKPALDYISENFTCETIPIEYLAKLCGISEPYLRILFHRTFSVSPAVYIRNLRIKRAKELLLTGEYSVAETATLAGFNDISYFSREFKKAIGVSPRSFQEKR